MYIYIYTYIRNGAGQKKTGYNSKTLNPVFNKIFSFLLDHSCITDKKLRVAVWDHDFFTEDDFNGESVVDLSTISLNAGTHRFGLCFNKRYIITVIIHKTYYKNSDWARAYSQETMAGEVNMVSQYLQQILGYHVEFKVYSISKPLW